MDGEADSQPQYPIGAVAQRTGLSTHVLRAWERRYGLVEPHRDDNGVRLYSNTDIVRLRLLRRITESGHPIGRIARLDTEQLLTLVREQEQTAEPSRGTGATEAADRYVSACLTAVEEMDGRRIHATLIRAVLGLSPMEFVEGVVSPLMRHVGELWQTGAICPAHEHLLSVCVQRVLAWLLDTLSSRPGAPVLLTTTLAGQRHEIGAMLAAVVASDVGWRTIFFGADLPVQDVATAAAAVHADAVALSLVYQGALGLDDMLRELRGRLPGNVFVFVGGPAAALQRGRLAEYGVTYLPDFTALRIALQATGRRTEAS